MIDYFQDKVFLITGASSGIGRATALELLERGALVALNARNTARLKAVREETALPERTLIVNGDIRKESEVKRITKKTIARWGRLDGIIHNAGVGMRAAADETSISVYRDLMDVHFFALIHLVRYGLGALQASGGHLVAVSSVLGKFSVPFRSGYTAAKHAMVGYLDSLRIELKPRGVHVLTVLPGYVRTELSLHALTADGRPHGIMERDTERGLSPRTVALDILYGIEDRKREVHPAGMKELLALLLGKWAPGLLDRMLVKRVTP